MQKKDYDEAEAAYKKAIEVKPNSADAYNGLANVYNAQKKFDQAAEASAKAMKLPAPAAGGGGAAAAAARRRSFNQGVILWNAGKIPEAKEQFEEAVKADPKLADAHYWLGMAQLNDGKMPDAEPHFEDYLKLAPTASTRSRRRASSSTSDQVSSGARCPSPTTSRRSAAGSLLRRSASGRRPSDVTPRRRLEDVRRRRRPRGRGRRPARLRREQGPGSPAEDRGNGRHTDAGGISSATSSRTRRRKAAPAFACIQSVDSRRLLRRLDDGGGRAARSDPLDVLVQVDLAGEATKFGAPPEDAERIVAARRVDAARAG